MYNSDTSIHSDFLCEPLAAYSSCCKQRALFEDELISTSPDDIRVIELLQVSVGSGLVLREHQVFLRLFGAINGNHRPKGKMPRRFIVNDSGISVIPTLILIWWMLPTYQMLIFLLEASLARIILWRQRSKTPEVLKGRKAFYGGRYIES